MFIYVYDVVSSECSCFKLLIYMWATKTQMCRRKSVHSNECVSFPHASSHCCADGIFLTRSHLHGYCLIKTPCWLFHQHFNGPLMDYSKNVIRVAAKFSHLSQIQRCTIFFSTDSLRISQPFRRAGILK